MIGYRADRLKVRRAGQAQPYLLFVGRLSVQLRLYGEKGEGGRVEYEQRQGNPRSLTRNSKIIKGFAVPYQDAPPPTPNPKYYQPHRSIVERSQALERQAGSQVRLASHCTSVSRASRRAGGQ